MREQFTRKDNIVKINLHYTEPERFSYFQTGQF